MQVEEQIEAATESLSPVADRTEALLAQILGLVPLLAVGLVAILVFWAFGRFLARSHFLIRRVSRGSELIEELLRRSIPLAFFLIGVVFALTILDAVAILSAILGAAGVLGIAVGFAVRDTIENYFASVLLSIRQPFRAKDFVAIGEHEGFVVRLTSRATILMSADGISIRIPNAQVFKAVITNYSRNPERRITFALGVDADDDPLAAMEAGVGKMKALDFALTDPPPRAWIEEVGDSNILVTYALWIRLNQTDLLKAKSAAIRAVKMTLEERGFTLPEPIYRLRIDQMPTGLGATVTETVADEKPRLSPRAEGGSQDTAPEMRIEKIVEEERAQTGGADLLDSNKPTEFGDMGKG